MELALEGAVFLIMGLEMTSILHELGSASAIWRGGLLGLLAIVVVLVFRTGYVALLVGGARRRVQNLDRYRERVGAFEDSLPDQVPAKVRRRMVRLRSDLDFYELENLGWRDGGVLVWAGMRGVVTLVAAQTLPADFPHRNLVVLIAFVVAAVSLLAQGGTLPWVVRVLRPSTVNEARLAQERRDLHVELLGAGLAEVFGSEKSGGATGSARPPADPQEAAVREKLRELAMRRGLAGPGEVPQAEPALAAALRRSRLQLVEAQRRALLRARDEGRYSSVVLVGALEALDAEQIALETRAETEDEPGGMV